MTTASIKDSETGSPPGIIVASPDRPGLLDGLVWRYRHSPWVQVVADRRRGERRRQQEPRGIDVRLGDRRGSAGDPVRPPAYRLVRIGEGYHMYEATGDASALCREGSLEPVS